MGFICICANSKEMFQFINHDKGGLCVWLCESFYISTEFLEQMRNKNEILKSKLLIKVNVKRMEEMFLCAVSRRNWFAIALIYQTNLYWFSALHWKIKLYCSSFSFEDLLLTYCMNTLPAATSCFRVTRLWNRV